MNIKVNSTGYNCKVYDIDAYLCVDFMCIILYLLNLKKEKKQTVKMVQNNCSFNVKWKI